MSSKRPTAAEARARFYYNPETGLLQRKIYLGKHGRTVTRNAGEITGAPTANGYLQVSFGGRPHLVHRVAYLWMTGRWPQKHMDHVNGDRSDNRWINLRLATQSQNSANRAGAAANVSGYKGVSFCATTGQWRARIKFKGKQTCLGRYSTPEAAHFAYATAAKRVHGRFARVG